jgi:hypothetical protein
MCEAGRISAAGTSTSRSLILPRATTTGMSLNADLGYPGPWGSARRRFSTGQRPLPPPQLFSNCQMLFAVTCLMASGRIAIAASLCGIGRVERVGIRFAALRCPNRAQTQLGRGFRVAQ